MTADSYAGLWTETFGRHGFSRRELDHFGIDTVWLTGEAGETVWEVAVDDRRPRGLGLIPRPIQTVLMHYRGPLVRSRDARDRRVGLLRTRQGVMVVAALPIVRGDDSGHKVGTLIFGRQLDGNALLRLEQADRLPVRITLLNERGAPTGTVAKAVADWPPRVRRLLRCSYRPATPARSTLTPC